MHVSTTLFDTSTPPDIEFSRGWNLAKKEGKEVPRQYSEELYTSIPSYVSQPRSIREVLFSSFPWIVEPMARHYSYLRSLLHAWLYFFNIKVTNNVLSPSTQHEETNQIPTDILIVSG